jgi:hypothetical protein
MFQRLPKRREGQYLSRQGSVQVEFRAGGKAYVSAGALIHACTYTESPKSVSLECNGNTTKFNVQEDGALVGPADGLMARLIPVQN